MSPLFDAGAFEALSQDLGPEDMQEALAEFFRDSRETAAALQADISDRKRAKRQAHSIKGSASNFGFAELSRVARELELMAETASPGPLAEGVAKLQAALEATQAFAQANLVGVKA